MFETYKLKFGLILSKVFKLLERKAECLEQLDKTEEAAEAYKSAYQMLSKSRLAKEKKDKLAENFRAKMKSCQAGDVGPKVTDEDKKNSTALKKKDDDDDQG